MEKELRKQAVWRNLVFWGKVAEKYIVTTMGFIWCYVLFFYWIGEKKFLGSNEIWTVLFIYQTMLMLISAFVAPLSYGTIYIPLVMSFGSKRNEAVWGFQLMNWLVVGEMGVLLVLFACLSSIKSEQLLAGTIFILFGGIIGFALGQFTVALGLRFGKKGLWIAGILFMIILVIVGVIITLFFIGRREISIAWYWLWLWAGLAVVLYLGSLLTLFRMIQKYEVRR